MGENELTVLSQEELKRYADKPYYHVGESDEGWKILPKNVAERPQDYNYGKTWVACTQKSG